MTRGTNKILLHTKKLADFITYLLLYNKLRGLKNIYYLTVSVWKDSAWLSWFSP